MRRLVLWGLAIGVAVIVGVSTYMFGPEWNEPDGNPLGQMVSTIAGFSLEDAETVFARQQAMLRNLPEVEDVGDWNGEGRAKIGVFYTGSGSGAGAWYLDTNGNGIFEGCTIDRCGVFGRPGYQPAVGDWNSDGKDEIGAFYAGVDANDPNKGSWYLDTNGNRIFEGCGPDACYLYGYGQPGDKAVTADWGGVGRSLLGVFRPNTAQWFLQTGSFPWYGFDCLSSGTRCFSFGQTGDLPVP